MKRPFEEVVRENTPWLYAFVKSKTENSAEAEDICQEIWLRLYRAYGTYREDGKLRAWIKTAALNQIYSHYRKEKTFFLSLDNRTDDEEDMYSYLSDGTSPEDNYIENELISEVLKQIDSLPKQQAQVLLLRFVNGFSVDECAEMLNIPKGSVKSKTHYAIDKVRKHMGITIEMPDTKKGDIIMTCENMRKYILSAALGKLPEDIKADAENHLAKCEACRDAVEALREIFKRELKEEGNATLTVIFRDLDLVVAAYHEPITKAFMSDEQLEALNAQIVANGGEKPDRACFFTARLERDCRFLYSCDELGKEIVYESEKKDDGIHLNCYKFGELRREMWVLAAVGSTDGSKYESRRQEYNETTGELICTEHNELYIPGKVSIFVSAGKGDKNLKIRRGNGIGEFGKYKFAYSQRYCVPDEAVELEYSYKE